MNGHFRSTLAVCCLVVEICGAGCAIVDDAHEDNWRNLVVTNVLRRADLPADVNLKCVNARTAKDDDTTAIVQYRTRRALHRIAFVLPLENQVAVGDHLSANTKLCIVRAAVAP